MDFPAKLTIEVTADDIAKGRASSCVQCPIALAASRALLFAVGYEGSYYVTVTLDLSVYTTKEEQQRLHLYMLPHEAHNFIVRFDRHESVEPFTFKATRL